MTSNKRALITGINGQDGYYLSKFLLEKGYEVFGLSRGGDSILNNYPKDLIIRLHIVDGDLENPESLRRAIEESNPDEIYNLAAISDLGSAIKDPEKTMRVNFEAVKELINFAFSQNPKIKFCQASSREIFDPNEKAPQNEKTLTNPTNPYGVAKLRAQEEIALARARGMFACSAIFFNHESPKRGDKFVTKKITSTLAKIKHGQDIVLELGNLNSKRDWGFAGDFMKAMWLIVQADMPDDFVIATGETHTVRDFVTLAAKSLGIDITWHGENEGETGTNQDGKIIVKVNPDFFRPLEKFDTVGDITKAKTILGWQPETSFKELVSMMTKSDFVSIK